MIVLGIAALILAGVLIAVPALQRNQRNNNRRADISYVQAQLTAYQGSNQNALPGANATGAGSATTTLNAMINGVTNNTDESAYYSANTDWSNEDNWNVINANTTLYRDGDTATEAALTTTNSQTNRNEYDLWLDGGTAGTSNSSDPGNGADPLPDEERFDVFLGFRCVVATHAPATGTNYPAFNTFVHEDGRARDFAIVYRLEGEDVWRCQDNT